MTTDRASTDRVPVQGERSYWLRDDDPRRAGTKVPGTISWCEHEKAWTAYAERYGRDQDAAKVADRGGFGYFELKALLGHEPQTWAPR